MQIEMVGGGEWQRAEGLQDLVANTTAERHQGVVYAVAFGDDVKIGCSTNIANRMQAMSRMADYAQVTIGTVLFSEPHKNYRESEGTLHRFFHGYRVARTELFALGIDDFISMAPPLKYYNGLDGVAIAKMNLTGAEHNILRYLEGVADFDNVASVSQSFLASELQTTEATVSVSIKHLIELGVIREEDVCGRKVFIIGQHISSRGKVKG